MSDGSILVDLMSFNLHILMPVANVIKPPQALKSQSTLAETIGIISEARKYKVRQIISCGMAITAVIAPKEHANTIAVKKSKIDFIIKMLESPDKPSVKAPKIVVVPKQSTTTSERYPDIASASITPVFPFIKHAAALLVPVLNALSMSIRLPTAEPSIIDSITADRE